MNVLITVLISILILILSFFGLSIKLICKKKNLLLSCSSIFLSSNLNNKNICLVCGKSI